MGQRSRAGRFSAVALDKRRTRCVLINPYGFIERRLTNQDLRAVRKLPLSTLPSDMSDDVMRMAMWLGGDVCYAMYAAPTHMVKFGRTADFRRRWATIEGRSGMRVQPLAAWRCSDTVRWESELFVRYSAARGIGEWFDADVVLPDLRRQFVGDVTALRLVANRRRPPVPLIVEPTDGSHEEVRFCG
jgi:hypothetical protein